MQKCENVISVLNPDFLVSSDEDELCRNTEERLHPMRKKVFRRNKSIKDDSDSDTEEDTMGIPEQDLDYTLYDNKTRMYSLARKGKVTLTKRSLDVRAVYREKRFLTVLIRNFYLCGRGIPYMVLMRGDGIRGVVGRHFLFEQKRLDPQLDSPLEKLWIDLNEIRNWGERGIIFGDRQDRYLDTVPFEVGKGGRVKKFVEDKVVDVIWYTDETNFSELKFQILERIFGDARHAVGENMRLDPYPGKSTVSDILGEGDNIEIVPESDLDETQESVEDVVVDINKKLYMEEKGQILNQVNLRMAQMQLENMWADDEGERRMHVLDNVTHLNLFFEITGDTRRAVAQVFPVAHVEEVTQEEEDVEGEVAEEEKVMEETGMEDDGGDAETEQEEHVMEDRCEQEPVEAGTGEPEETCVDAPKDTDVEFDKIVDRIGEDDSMVVDSQSDDTDTVFDKIISQLDQMLDENDAKIQLYVNRFRGCCLPVYEM